MTTMGVRRVVLFALVFAPQFAWAIVNGVPIGKAQYPEVAKYLVTQSSPNKKKISVVGTGSCTGTFITDSELLTAGHCVHPNINPENVILYSFGQKKLRKTVRALGVFTNFNESYEKLIAKRLSDLAIYQTVPECYRTEIPLLLTKTVDLAIIRFPKKTSSHWDTLDMDYLPQLGDTLSYVGYGEIFNHFLATGSFSSPLIVDKKLGTSQVFRINSQRLAFKSSDLHVFATNGDSGGPVFKNGSLVGIMSTVEKNCESEFGSDYGILNSAVLLSNPDSRRFITDYFVSTSTTVPSSF